MPSYENCLLSTSLHSFLFGIALAHGKRTIKNNELFPLKITIPLTSSLLGKKEFFEKMTDVLHQNQIIHTVNYSQTPTYEIMQLTLHDPVLLDQFSQWLNPIVNITQISTLENTQKVYDILLKYTTEQ
jgi:mannitol/fructose-specific phosphotransferase system IIA component (Ntr-type)